MTAKERRDKIDALNLKSGNLMAGLRENGEVPAQPDIPDFPDIPTEANPPDPAP